MRIGEFSRLTGVSVRMLRYYEDERLLQPIRTGAGYRDYGPTEEQIVRRIRLLASAGLKLGTIRQMLRCVRSDQPAFEPCDEVRRSMKQQLNVLDQQIGALTENRKILAKFAASVDSGKARQRASLHCSLASQGRP
jgi:DNA-binding transcriptional MerR regulator